MALMLKRSTRPQFTHVRLVVFDSIGSEMYEIKAASQIKTIIGYLPTKAQKIVIMDRCNLPLADPRPDIDSKKLYAILNAPSTIKSLPHKLPFPERALPRLRRMG